MKMYLCDRHAVYMTFRLRNQTKNRQNIFLHPLRYGQFLHNMLNLMHTTVMMCMRMITCMLLFVLMRMVMFMRVLMHRFGFFFPVNAHRNMRAADTALAYRFCLHFHTRDSQVIQLRHHLLPLRHQFQQCRREHISRSTHSAIQI